MTAMEAQPRGSRRVIITPTSADVVDALALVILGVLALLEFQSTYSGLDYLAVGIVGLVLGVVITHIGNVLARPVIVLIAMGLAAFFLLGGAVALRDAPGGSVFPTGSTLHGLADVSVHGWKNLLTTVPPVDGTGNLLVLPYILGLFGGLGGFALARRTTGVLLAMVAPIGVFALVILLGSTHPKDTGILATLFAIVALVWASVRNARQRPLAATGAARNTRIGIAAALLAASALGAYAIGPHLPGAGAHQRLVLRKHVNPPIDIQNYPSPLAEFREYVGKQRATDAAGQTQVVSLSNQPLFTVGGTLPVGSPIRFATLDNYNGSVWAATTDGTSQGDRPNAFLRVGRRIDNPASGPDYSMNVTIAKYDDYWMPDSGDVQAVAFTDADKTQQDQDFRYDLATGTGVAPSKLTAGSTYNLTVSGVNEPSLQASDVLASDGSAAQGSFLKDAATALAGATGNTTAQVLKMAETLRTTGRYTNGDPGTHFEYYLPGNSAGRLTAFALKGVIPGVLYVGDDEQYAAAYALMIGDLGVPARVVMGVERLPASRTVMGSDVDAWVEVQTVSGGWRAIPSEVFMDKNNPPDTKQLQQQQQQEAGSVVPPPPQGHPTSALEDAAQSVGNSNDIVKKKAAAKHKAAAIPVPGWLGEAVTIVGSAVGLVLLVCMSILAAKAVRRWRRRASGPPSLRLARGWRELLDHARDLGHETLSRRTRREQAADIDWTSAAQLAKQADAHAFGPTEVTDGDVTAFWGDMNRVRKHLSEAVSPWRRLRASLSLRSFFPMAGTS